MKNLLLLVFSAFVFASPVFAQKTSFEYLAEGSKHYVAGEYKKAVPPYQKALDLEKQERKLERKLWIGRHTFSTRLASYNPKSAIQNPKSNGMLPGTRLPNPEIDSSFEKFRDSEKFKKAVAEMKRGK